MKKRPIQERIGDAVRQRRKDAEYSQEDFADHIGMSRAYYGVLERGGKDLRASTIERICAGLKVSMWELIRDAESLR